MSPSLLPHGLQVSITMAFVLSLTFLPPPTSGGGIELLGNGGNLEERKMVLGSKPPACVSKCMNCRPCMATLVVPPSHQIRRSSSRPLSHKEDDSYYLLSWKCRCGNKLFQP